MVGWLAGRMVEKKEGGMKRFVFPLMTLRTHEHHFLTESLTHRIGEEQSNVI